LGFGRALSLALVGSHREKAVGRLAAPLRSSHLFCRDLRRSTTLSWHVLPGGQLDSLRRDDRAWQGRANRQAQSPDQGSTRLHELKGAIELGLRLNIAVQINAIVFADGSSH